MTTVTPADIARKRAEILDHIAAVRLWMAELTVRLTARADVHDASKLQEPELSGFAALQLRKEEMDYGGPTYAAGLDEARAVIAIHYCANDHHPEHWANGIEDMSLLAVLEMLADWKAASGETRNGSLRKSLTVNIDRFGISPQLARILWNTARELGWLDEDDV